MANEPVKADKGIFVDTKTDEIVEEQPEEGIQIVAPGGVIDDHAKKALVAADADVDALVAGSTPLEVAAVDETVEVADDPEKTVKSK